MFSCCFLSLFIGVHLKCPRRKNIPVFVRRGRVSFLKTGDTFSSRKGGIRSPQQCGVDLSVTTAKGFASLRHEWVYIYQGVCCMHGIASVAPASKLGKVSEGRGWKLRRRVGGCCTEEHCHALVRRTSRVHEAKYTSSVRPGTQYYGKKTSHLSSRCERIVDKARGVGPWCSTVQFYPTLGS